MTLVLQTTVETKPDSDDAIRAVIERYGLQPEEAPVSFGVDTFTYYRVGNHLDVRAIIRELMELPGVASAYIKTGGTPAI